MTLRTHHISQLGSGGEFFKKFAPPLNQDEKDMIVNIMEKRNRQGPKVSCRDAWEDFLQVYERKDPRTTSFSAGKMGRAAAYRAYQIWDFNFPSISRTGLKRNSFSAREAFLALSVAEG